MKHFLCSLSLCATALCAAPCEHSPLPSGLTVQEGFLQFIPDTQLNPFLAALPKLDDAQTDARMRSSETMWYDEESMVFVYQDSVEVVTGVRANCVGRKVGVANQSNPQIGKLMNYFGSDYRFLFPFRKAAGTENVQDIRVFNFWSPPKKAGKVLPVKWWIRSNRSRWHWVFPVDTLFGEVLFQKAPDGSWVPFEVRTRKRYREGWAVDQFRPFVTADALATAVMDRRPDWYLSVRLRDFVNHLMNKNTLVSHKLESKPYSKVFPAILGALDPLPDPADATLVKQLLTEYPFVSAEGTLWKSNSTLETYAPASQGGFSVVPKGYEMGMIPVNEISCNRCHSEVGRRLGEFEFDISLYGEVWGEDRIFTWHLFEVKREIFDTFDEVDGSRKINQKMVKANLLKNEQPSATDPDYKMLPHAFTPFRGKK